MIIEKAIRVWCGGLLLAAMGSACSAEDTAAEPVDETAEAARSSCGNGIRNFREECDDGNRRNTDRCLNNCRLAHCGDGFVRGHFEQCDDGNRIDTDGCNNRCRLPRTSCGDGIVQISNGESCDDGNDDNGDSCSFCRPPTCGNAEVNPGEECDDGNSDNEDECTNACLTPRCGDAVVQSANGEECDDGNTVETDACGNDCLLD